MVGLVAWAACQSRPIGSGGDEGGGSGPAGVTASGTAADDGCLTEAATLCDGECIDTTVDPLHCGACGAACAEPRSCVEGRCVDARYWHGAELVENDLDKADEPDVAFGAGGDAFAVWTQGYTTGDSVWASRYEAASHTWGAPVLLETASGLAWSPRIRVAPDGSATAVWDQRTNTPWNGNDVWVNRYDAAAQAWGSAEIIDLEGAGRAHYPEVAVDSRGDAIVVWQQLPDLDGGDFRIYARRYDAGSGTWGSVERLEDDGGGAAIDPLLAGDPAGNVVVVWHREQGRGYEARINRYDAATQQWATPQTLGPELGFGGRPQVAALPDGDALATWTDDGVTHHVWARHYDAGRSAWGVAERIDEGPEGLDAGGSLVAVPDEGDAVVGWWQDDGTRTAPWIRRYASATGTWGAPEPLPLEEPSLAGPLVLAVDSAGNVHAAWTQDADEQSPEWTNVWAMRYDASEQAWEAPQLLEQLDASGSIRPLRLTIDPRGDVIAIWSQYDTRYNVYANVYR